MSMPAIAALVASMNNRRLQELFEENEKEKEAAVQKCIECGEPCSYGICDECPAKRDD